MLRTTISTLFHSQDTPTPTCAGSVRVARHSDIGSIMEIMERTFKLTYHDDEFGKCCFNQSEIQQILDVEKIKYQQKLVDKDNLTLVACSDEKVVGFARISRKPQFSYLEKLYVLPEYQHPHQHGKYLMLSCLMSSASYFLQNTMRLEVWNRNTRAIKFYEANQFHKLSEKPETRKTSVSSYDGYFMQCDNVLEASDKLKDFIRVSSIQNKY
jgi:ribosomal protein S18 acetylase RimI-like enzyme